MKKFNFEPDYAKWWAKKTLTKEQLCWLLLGINPSDMKKHNKIVDRGTPMSAEETAWQNAFFNYQRNLPHSIDIGRTYQQYLKLFNWSNGKKGLVQQAYESHEELPESFKKLLIKNKVLKPSKKLEQYNDHSLYALDIKTLDTNTIKTAIDAFSVLLGFKPEDFSRFYALERRQRDEERDKDGFAAYVRFKPEDKWFYSEYRKFVAGSYEGRDGHFFAIYAWEEARYLDAWEGDFAKYAQRLHNEGFIFKQDVVEAIRKLGIELQYTKDGWAYNFYEHWLRQGGWTQTEAIYLFKGQSPDKNERSFIDLSQNPYILNVGVNDGMLSWDNLSTKFEHLEHTLERHIAVGKVKAHDFKDGKLFNPEEITSWLRQHSLYIPPATLLQALGIKETQKERTKRAAESKKASEELLKAKRKAPEIHHCIGWAWDAVKKENGDKKASATDVWNKLVKSQDRFDCIVRFETSQKTKEEAIIWETQNGLSQELAFSSFRNIVSDFNTEKKKYEPSQNNF